MRWTWNANRSNVIFCAQLARFMEANSTMLAPRVNLFGVRKYVIGSRTLLRPSSIYIYTYIRIWSFASEYSGVQFHRSLTAYRYALFCSTYIRNAYKYRRGGKSATTTTLHFYPCLSLLAVNVDEERGKGGGEEDINSLYRFRPFVSIILIGRPNLMNR